ncbi:MAG: mannose-1-phosphate guanylyltransferase [Janthinobacterium lividum]
MNKRPVYLVIMAGGVGSRFWPFSRTQHPKQFHDVLGVGRSMLQLTLDRFAGICPIENVFVVTNRDYIDLVHEHLPALPLDQILGEPIGRNTAPCIAYASYRIAQRDPEAVLIVTPADHVVLREEEFRRLMREAVAAAGQHAALLTLGVRPTRPDTGYGYIQYRDEATHHLPGTELLKVKTFTEKPNLDMALSFLDSGDFLWNAGLFVGRVDVIRQALEQHLGEVAELFADDDGQLGTPAEAAFIDYVYARCPNVSIDYGVLEKADNVYVLPADIGWSDLGTWDSLHRVSAHDAHHNVIDGEVMLYDTQQCIIKTPHGRLVVVQGLDHYIVAEYDNVLLICQRSEEQRVKEFVTNARARMGNGYH